ncbi:MAG: GNAT family protein [Planctomycetota bacterium]
MSTADHDFEPQIAPRTDSQNVTLRRAMPNDASAILDYMHNILPEVTPYICTTPEEFDYTVEQESEMLAKQDPAKGDLYVLAEHESQVVGSLNISPLRRTRLAHVSLLGMTLRAEFRGVGIGTAMMHAVIAWAERHPVTELLQLEVYADNERARRLYRRVGFVEVGRIPRRMKFGPGEYKDSIVMYRDVSCSKPGMTS